MRIGDTHPASKTVIALLALVVLGLAVFLAPKIAEGRRGEFGQVLRVTDALAISDKCLTLNQKGVNCVRLGTDQPAGSVQSIYSHFVGSKTDIGKTQEFAQTDRRAGLHSYALGSVTR